MQCSVMWTALLLSLVVAASAADFGSEDKETFKQRNVSEFHNAFRYQTLFVFTSITKVLVSLLPNRFYS